MAHTLNRESACPCGGYDQHRTWGTCCGPLVEDGLLAETAEQLMRSRYSAFATANSEHLWRTWHPRTRPAELGPLGEETWVQLTVMATSQGGPQDNDGTVDFEAQFVQGGQRGAVREHSRFTKRAGRWFYVDGDELA